MKQKKSIKKYVIDSGLTDTVSNQIHISDIRQQLRQAIEQLEQLKLSNQLESQKRLIAEQQCQMLRQQNQQLRIQLQSINKQLNRFSKKYSKAKEQKTCDKCKADQQFKQKIQKQREIYLKQRSVLKSEINELKKIIQTKPQQSKQARHYQNTDSLKKQIIYKDRTIQDQRKIIRYLDQKLSSFQLQKMQTLNYVQSIDQKLQELQMQNLILKGIGRRQHSPNRKNGSIKNLERLQKSRSRLSKVSPTHY